MNRKIVDYKICYGSSLFDLKKEILEYVDKGYELYGNPFSNYHHRYEEEYFYQAMVKYAD